MLGKLRFLDSFKMSIFNNETDKFYEDFEYGLDEIIINQIINYYVRMKKIKITVFHIKNRVELAFFRKRIIEFLDWNNRKTDLMFYLFKIYKVKSFSELKNLLFKMKTLTEFFGLLRKKETIAVLNQLQFDKRLICLIKDFNQKEVDSYPLSSDYLV
jgi:hypothetical protein